MGNRSRPDGALAAGVSCCPLYLRDSPGLIPIAGGGLAPSVGCPGVRAASLQQGNARIPAGVSSVLLPERSAAACAFGGLARCAAALSWRASILLALPACQGQGVCRVFV